MEVQGYQQVVLQGVWPVASVWWVSFAWLALVALVLNVVVARSRDQLVDWL